jgi:Uma2 family endonuclease
MSLPKPVEYISVEEYLEGEQVGDVKHEYIAGQVYAMAGTSLEHNQLALNVASWLRRRLRGGRCRTFISDVKVRIDPIGTFYYPDVVVTCEEEGKARYYISRPCLIVEVLSPSTEVIDRREKLLTCRQLDSLREYVLIAQDERRIEVYRRDDAGEWGQEILGPNADLRFESLPGGALSMTMDEVYEDVEFERE